jgi:integrase
MKNSWLFVASVLRESTDTLAPSIKLPQVVPIDRHFLDSEQIKVFIAAVNGKECEIPALLALSSLRCSEICALTWENIDLKNSRILVSGAMVQNDEQKFVLKPTNKNIPSRRYVPIMIRELYNALESSDACQGHVFSGNPNTMWAQINRVCRDNDLPLVGVHGLRHSFTSLAYHLNMPEKIAMQIGGWSDGETMSKIYTHLAQKDISKYETI